ncbi:MAG: alpha-glucuronidase family glycosyl hydrolase [Agriterribacter sp.]
MRSKLLLVFLLLFCLQQSSFSQSIDLSKAVVWVSETKTVLLAKPVQVLREEIEKRTHIDLKVSSKIPDEKESIIYIVAEENIHKLPKEIEQALIALPATGEEGFKLLAWKATASVIITGKNARSILYGVGRLLRKADMRAGQISFPESLAIATSPVYPIRGHQLGYRPKTNSYDAFSVKQYDQYIRELALFGANSIEILPPRTDDDDTSVHMKLRPAKMIVEQSRICKSYNLDVWMWYPNMGRITATAIHCGMSCRKEWKYLLRFQNLIMCLCQAETPENWSPISCSVG